MRPKTPAANKPLTPLGPHSKESFLRDYWQKKPLFIKSALPNFSSPLSPEHLAGLACEEDVESRIVRELKKAPYWQCDYGPFTEQDFLNLPESHWTLLVQECNKYHIELAQLLDRFNFIPNWRVDDVMVSFAPQQGSVGPHLDQYDVFLIQAMGKRRWQINNLQYTEKDFHRGIPLHILKSFQAKEEWVVEPGDILYLPPGVAHYGVALEDCITISVGFRAPTYADLLSGYTEHRIREMALSGEARYSDPDLSLQTFSGEITAATVEKITRELQHLFAQTQSAHQWFAELITEPVNDPAPEPEPPYSMEEFCTMLEQEGHLYRSEYSRFAFVNQPECRALYVDGCGTALDEEQLTLAQLLCNQRRYSAAQLQAFLQKDKSLSLLLHLLNTGKLYFPDDENDDEDEF